MNLGLDNTIREIIGSILEMVKENALYFLNEFLDVLLVVIRASCLILGLLGLFLWLSHISPHRGKGMILGSIILALVTEIASKFL